MMKVPSLALLNDVVLVGLVAAGLLIRLLGGLLISEPTATAAPGEVLFIFLLVVIAMGSASAESLPPAALNSVPEAGMCAYGHSHWGMCCNC